MGTTKAEKALQAAKDSMKAARVAEDAMKAVKDTMKTPDVARDSMRAMEAARDATKGPVDAAKAAARAPIEAARDAMKAVEAARKLAKTADSWVDLHNRLFGIGGEITRLFPTEQSRTEFAKSDQAAQVYALFDELREAKGDPEAGQFAQKLGRANGALSLRLPRSVHAALLLEAEAEGVSLNQLCLSKLLVQLRALA